MENTMTIMLNDKMLTAVAGGSSKEPDNCGGLVDQYAVKAGCRYYYHYTGGGHDQWLIILVNSV